MNKLVVALLLFLSYVGSAGANYGIFRGDTNDVKAVVGPVHNGCVYFDLSDQCRKAIDHWYQRKEPVVYFPIWDNHLRLPALDMVELMAKIEKVNPSAEEIKTLAVEHLVRQQTYPVTVFKEDKKIATISNGQLLIGYILLVMGAVILVITVEASIRREDKAHERNNGTNST